MLDIKWIASNPEEFNKGLKKRGVNFDANEIILRDEERRRLTALIQQFQHSRKEKSRSMSSMDKSSEEFKLAKRDVEHINEKLEETMKKASDSDHLHGILEGLPNIPDLSVPEGRDENDNKLIRTYGDPQQIPGAKQHFELGEGLGMMEFEQTVKMSGSRFVTLTGDLAKLERAVASFMLDVQTKEFGFYEVSPPYLVRPVAMYNAGQLPKFEEESFVTTTDYRLIPTSEVSLINMVMDKIIPREKLPIRYVAHTPCFRSEAGSAGKDTRGMFRVHQFSKVELVTISTPEESEKEHEHIVSAAESILKKLELPYRLMLLCAGDMGFHAKKTYDFEVWLPGQNRYREISSCSNCGDYQARRLKARYKEFGATETTLVHTLNGSGLAVGRTIIAILENYQNGDGSITVPKVLQSYMGGMERIEKLK